MKKKSLLLIALALAFLLINTVGLYVGNKLYVESCRIETASISTVYNIYKYTFDDVRFYSYVKEDITINSKFGYKLYGTYVYNPKPSKNTVILLHGVRDNRWSSSKYVDMYINKGFNVLIYDSRHHGESGGDTVTFGYYEKYDLDSFVDWVSKKNPTGIIGVHGESMGAATALLHSQLNEKSKRVKFYIADSAYSDLSSVFVKALKEEYHISNPVLDQGLIFYASIVSFARSGFTFYQVSPIKAIKDVRTPILFIYGKLDIVVPPYMSENMYNVKKGSKDIFFSPKAGHISSFVDDKSNYISKVYKFIDNSISKTNYAN